MLFFFLFFLKGGGRRGHSIEVPLFYVFLSVSCRSWNSGSSLLWLQFLSCKQGCDNFSRCVLLICLLDISRFLTVPANWHISVKKFLCCPSKLDLYIRQRTLKGVYRSQCIVVWLFGWVLHIEFAEWTT